MNFMENKPLAGDNEEVSDRPGLIITSAERRFDIEGRITAEPRCTFEVLIGRCADMRRNSILSLSHTHTLVEGNLPVIKSLISGFIKSVGD